MSLLRFRFWRSGALTIWFAATAWAVDPTGTIIGLVTDPDGRPVPGVEIVIRNQGTNTERRTRTTGIGDFTMPLLPPAVYEVSAEIPNFKRAIYPDVSVAVNTTVRTDLQLELGDLNQSIEVTTEPPLVQTDTSTVEHGVQDREIHQLPLNERNFLAFTLLVPGSQLPADGSQSASNGASVSVNGAREQSNNFLLDGVDNNDTAINTYSALPSAAAIEQFEVQSSNSSAEFGRSGGAQINVVLKSGTNDFHGTAFGFVRNRHLDAKNFFDKPDCTATSVEGTCAQIPRLDRNQFGGTFGGPVLRNKTFFFGSYEGLRLRQGITRGATVPSQVQRMAALSAVPGAQQNPAGVNLLNLYPAANVGTDLTTSNRFVAAPTMQKDVDLYTVKLNHTLSDQDALSGHFVLTQTNSYEPYDPFFAFTNLPGFGVFAGGRGQNGSVNWIRQISPEMVNEARLGFNRLSAARDQQSQGTQSGTSLGFPQIVPDSSAQGYPAVVLPGFDSIGEPINTPQNRSDTTIHIADTLAWNPGGGRHNFRLGVDIRRINVDLSLYLLARGQFQFLGVFTGNPLQDLVLGTPTFAIGVAGDPRTSIQTLSQNYFFQDNFRLHPRLTLNLGLRYEYNRPPVDVNNALSRPSFAPGASACTPQPDCLYTVAGTNGLPRATFNPDRNNFAPRVGLAWRPPGLGQTVIRTGYGVFYDIAILNVNVASHFNPPFYQSFLYPNPGTSTIQNIIGPASVSPPSMPNLIDSNFRDAYVQQWNFEIQHELWKDTVLEVAYIGSKGTHLTDRRNPNQPRPGGSPPYPQFGAWTYWESGSSSVYHSMQVRAEKRWSAGYSFLMSYTWSKSIDNVSSLFQTSSEPAFPQDSLNMRAERGLSNFDARHRFVFSHLYELPFGAGKQWFSQPGIVNYLLGGWSLNGIWSVQSGRPFTVNRNLDQSGTGTFILAPSDRPDVISNPFQAGPVPANPDPGCHASVSSGGRAPDVVRTPDFWFNPCAFVAAPGGFGNSGRNALIGPGLRNVDLALMRDVPLGELQRLQFRFEFFNVFNHPNFDIPNRVFDSSTFGAIRSSNGYGNKPPRQIQLSMRFLF